MAAIGRQLAGAAGAPFSGEPPLNAEIRHRPSFAAIFITLAPGEAVTAVSEAMASMSSHLKIRVRFFGGVWRAVLRRLFGGESLFMNQFYCSADGRPGELVLSQATPGDIAQLDVRPAAPLFVRPGAFIACGTNVRVGLSYAGLRSWFNNQGLFRLKLTGEGPAFVGAFGSIFTRQVSGTYLVDTGFLLAYDANIQLGLGFASRSWFSRIFSREGAVTRLRGHGTVHLQSRSLDGLVRWTNAHLR